MCEHAGLVCLRALEVPLKQDGGWRQGGVLACHFRGVAVMRRWGTGGRLCELALRDPKLWEHQSCGRDKRPVLRVFVRPSR